MKGIAIAVVTALEMQAQAPVPTRDADRAVLFPADRAATLLTQCSRRVPGPVQSTWLPDIATIAKLDALLGRAFDEAVQKAGRPVADRHPLSEYYRQYGGVVVGGRRIVYVNAFHQHLLELPAMIRPPRPPMDWRQFAVNVCDGWTMFFGAEYDPDSGKIEAVTFNGRGLPDPLAVPNCASQPLLSPAITTSWSGPLRPSRGPSQTLSW